MSSCRSLFRLDETSQRTVRATAYLGTPSFLYTLLKRGRELGSPLGIEVAFVTAEMLPESLRAEVENDFHARLLQGYGTADQGLLAYECTEKSGMSGFSELTITSTPCVAAIGAPLVRAKK